MLESRPVSNASSVPGNPLVAESMYLAGYIERMGTGTQDMIVRCREAGLREPEFAVRDGFVIVVRRPAAPEVTPEVTPEVRFLLALKEPLSRRALQAALGLRDDEHFRKAYLLPALEAGWVEMTIPDKPNSRLQKYRLTAAGQARLLQLQRGEQQS